MRLGLITGEFPPMQGGVGDFTHELAAALMALGVDTHVLTSRKAQPTSGLKLPAAHVHPLINRWSFAALWTIRRWARALQLDLLNVQYQAAAYHLGAPIHFLPLVAGVQTVVTFHDLRIPYLFPKAGPLRPWAVTHLARAAAGVIVTDRADEAELQRRGGVRRLVQIPIGSNIAPPDIEDRDLEGSKNLRGLIRARLGLAPGEALIGYFGFLNASKGGDVLLEALARLRQRQPAKLALIGGPVGASDSANAAFGATLDALAAERGLTAAIIRTGFVAAAEVSAYLLACDVLALPYRDGASLRRGTLMAALAHGCPIITTQPANPLPELQDGVNVRLIPPNDAAALTDALTRLLADAETRARLGAGAQALAGQFRWETIAARTLAFYRAL